MVNHFQELLDTTRAHGINVEPLDQDIRENIVNLRMEIGIVLLKGNQPRLGAFRQTGHDNAGKPITAIEYGFHINEYLSTEYKIMGIEKRAAKNDPTEYVVFERTNQPFPDALPHTLWLVEFKAITTGLTEVIANDKILLY